MRKRKVILLFSGDEEELSTLAFTLETSRYRVLKASAEAEAVELMRNNEVDLAILDSGFHWFTTNELATQLKDLCACVPVVLLGEPNGFPHVAEAMLSKSTTSTAELLQRIRFMAARKRGPKSCSICRLVQVA